MRGPSVVRVLWDSGERGSGDTARAPWQGSAGKRHGTEDTAGGAGKEGAATGRRRWKGALDGGALEGDMGRKRRQERRTYVCDLISIAEVVRF